MASILVNTFTGERFIALPYSTNLYKILNIETGSYFLWTAFDLDYALESGKYEHQEDE